jgi:predicted N-formylglutamate amidohydrolase
MSPSSRPLPPRPLLGPDEPPPFDTANAEGAAPILLVCDHASNRIPAALGNLGLDAAALELHVAFDIGAGDITRELAALLDAPALLANYSRLVVDLNRPPEHPTSIMETSDDVAVPGNRNLDAAAREERLAALYRPYHRAVGERVAALARRGPPPMLLAVHSFTPRLGGEDRRWHAGILYNRDPRLAHALIEGLSAAGAHAPKLQDPAADSAPGLLSGRPAPPGDIVVGDNEPYSGRTLFHTLDVHAGAAGLAHAGIEVRQDLVLDTGRARAWAERLAAVLRPLVGRADLHRVERFD